LERIAFVGRLKAGVEARAAELIAEGPPFDAAGSHFLRHAVYLSDREVVFVFEGHDVEWLVDSLIDDSFNSMVSETLEKWKLLLEEQPRVAREQFSWDRETAPQI